MDEEEDAPAPPAATDNAALGLAELARLKEAPPGVPTETSLLDPPLRLMDGPSFASQYEQIFIEEAYDFPFEGSSPTIIDGGANVGVAAIWWSARWPQAKILAVEPDPLVFEALRWNTRHHRNIQLVCAALGSDETGSVFLSEGSDAGRLGEPSDAFGKPILVGTLRLSSILAGFSSVDLLKLDIEGAETAVLAEAESHLDVVDRIFVEYHSIEGREQVLDELLLLLKRRGFRYYLESSVSSMRPFKGVHAERGIDAQCDVFAWRPALSLAGGPTIEADPTAAG